VSDWIIEVVRSLRYLGIALLALLENACPPIPSELIMPLAGYMAASGDMSLAGAIAAGSIGSLIGCIGWYLIGRRIGERRLRAWIDRHGHWLTLCQEDIDTAQAKLRKHGSAVVFFGRLIPGIRTWVSVPAGLSGMPPLKFIAYTTAGTVLWTAALTVAGYFLGSRFPAIGKYLGGISTAVFVLMGVWYVWRVVAQLRRRTHHA
jgi:membrane protein DedA with SNARE-associated domain